MQTSPEVDQAVAALEAAGITITKHREAFNTVMMFQIGKIPADQCVQKLNQLLNQAVIAKTVPTGIDALVSTKMHKRAILYMYGLSLWQIGALEHPPISRASVWQSIRRYFQHKGIKKTTHFKRSVTIHETEAAIASRVYDLLVFDLSMPAPVQADFFRSKVQEFIATHPE